MATSKLPGVLQPPTGFCAIPPRSCGVLGLLDQGDPNYTSLLGDTCGPLGVNDWGSPFLPPWGAVLDKPAGTLGRAPDGKPVSTGSTTPATATTGLITRAVLKAAEPTCTDAYLDSLLDGMNKYAKAYAINTPLRIAHFLAQISHESHLKVVEEGGSYSGPRMREIFGCIKGKYNKVTDDCRLGRLRDKLWTQEATYIHNPKNLLSYAYASRMGNGDEASCEGYTYRGRGMMQLTGKSTYGAFSRSHNQRSPGDHRDFVGNPDLIVSVAEYGVESAFFFWNSRNANQLADQDKISDVTFKVNGGYNGLPDRTARLARIKTALGI